MSKNPFAAPFLLLVLQQLIKVRSDCYNELGCFPMSYPWVSPLRPLPSPQPPWTIDVHLYLWTRSRSTRQNVTLWPSVSVEGTDYNAARTSTVFIAHGFVSDGSMGWIDRMKNAYLDRVDANVFITDWGKGAKQLSYLQAASNIRIVGAELARFGKYLVNNGLDKSKFHLIGHSLGAHVMSYMAKGLLTNGTKVGRITGLDPAQPGFEGTSSRVRLTIEDADFIDVLHTDARPFIPFLGFGMLRPLGHVDFYVNGGSGQPGCLTANVKPVNSITDLIDIPMEILLQLVSCSHLRSYDIFIAALSNNCTLWEGNCPCSKAL